MSTFVIVHGAWGSPKEMEPVVGPLESAGHSVVVVDLPCTVAESTLEDYGATVENALPDDLNDVVLVGHSFGGFTISTVASHPELPLIYVAAVVPQPGQSLLDVFVGGDPFVDGDEAAGIASFEGLVTAAGPGLCELDIEVMAAEVAPAEREQTLEYLRETQRAQGIAAMRQKWHGNLPSGRPITYILTTSDTLVLPEAQRAMAESIGATIIEIDTDHSAFGEQPEQLAALLLGAAGTPVVS